MGNENYLGHFCYICKVSLNMLGIQCEIIYLETAKTNFLHLFGIEICVSGAIVFKNHKIWHPEVFYLH